MKLKLIFLVGCLVLLLGMPKLYAQKAKLERATFGMGCFWCTEAVFQQLKGVSAVRSGYAGGKSKNPNYMQVSTGRSGHAEVLEILFNPKEISYEQLLEVFWSSHDPTTLNRQGADIGTQYRSVIFYHNESQKASALKLKALLNKNKVFPRPIVTEIAAQAPFYEAEAEHQNYYNRNKNAAYCRVVIQPKLEQLHKVFKNLLKP